jgi:hypothetical protein
MPGLRLTMLAWDWDSLCTESSHFFPVHGRRDEPVRGVEEGNGAACPGDDLVAVAGVDGVFDRFEARGGREAAVSAPSVGARLLA